MTAHDKLATLLAPLDVATFFERHHEREPLHLPAIEGSRRGVLTHRDLLAALAGRRDPPEGLLAFPEHLSSVAGRSVSLADLVSEPALLAAYLDEGHPLVWNRARGLTPPYGSYAASSGPAPLGVNNQSHAPWAFVQ